MAWIYVVITIIGITSVGFFTAVAIRKGIKGEDMTLSLFAFSALIGATVALISPVVSGKPIVFSRVIFFIALIAGLGGAAGYFLFNKAIENGHYGFSNAIYRSNFIIAVLFSIFVFNQPATFSNITGILLTVISISLISYANQSFELPKWEKNGLYWFFTIIAAFLLSSITRIAQQTVNQFREDEKAYLCLSYLPGLIIFLLDRIRSRSFDRRALLYGALASVGSYISVYSTIKAFEGLKGVVVFPVTLCGPIILGVFLSRMFFKEKIRPLGYFGIFVGICGIVILYVFK